MSFPNLPAFLLLLSGLTALLNFGSKPSDDHRANGSGNQHSAIIPQKNSVGELPLKIFGTTTESALPMLVYISGDGGWNKFNASLCSYLNQKGIPVVALDAQQYFWERKTPDGTSEELAAVIAKFQKKWNKDKFVLAGFSFGADILPFLLNRFPAPIFNGLVVSILLSPDKTCDFEIHLTDMLNMGFSKGKYDVIKEIKGSKFVRFTAVFGKDESKNLQQGFQTTGAKIIVLQGGHHFDDDYVALGNLMIAEMR
jgi:type IV secretory pathway VirJ component